MIVLACGCFDVLHAGHIRHLRAARALGDMLIVALTVDHAVNKGPGRPINTWGNRAMVLRELNCVDHVTMSIDGPSAILKIRPDIYVKGFDYEDSPLADGDREACELVGARFMITRTPKMSSTEIIRRVAA